MENRMTTEIKRKIIEMDDRYTETQAKQMAEGIAHYLQEVVIPDTMSDNSPENFDETEALRNARASEQVERFLFRN